MSTLVHVKVSVAPRSGSTGPEALDPLLFAYAGSASPNGDIDLTAIKDDVSLVFELATTEVEWAGAKHKVRLSRDKGARETLWIRPVGQAKGPTSHSTFQFIDFREPPNAPNAVSVTAANSKPGAYAYGIEVELSPRDPTQKWRRVRHDPQIKNGGNSNVINAGSIRVLQILTVVGLVVFGIACLVRRLML